MEISQKYDDIIDLPHHVSERHPQMPMIDRAAQFSPFAALTGYDSAILETARLTEQKRELTEEQKHLVSRRLAELQAQLDIEPVVRLVYFEADARKSGGTYRNITSTVRKINALNGTLEMTDGTVIHFDDVLSIE